MTPFSSSSLSALLDAGARALARARRARATAVKAHHKARRFADATREVTLALGFAFPTICGASDAMEPTPLSLWIAPSSGRACEACGQQIVAGHMEYVLVGGGREMRLDRACYRQRMEADASDGLVQRYAHRERDAEAKSLAILVRQKLDDGTLPHDPPVRLWAGQGRGGPCAACGQPIVSTQLEYEPEYTDARTAIRLHLGCHGVWEAERRRRGDPDGV
jgi:hypothetical protein